MASIGDFTDQSSNNRKVSSSGGYEDLNKGSNSSVVNQGDTKAFKDTTNAMGKDQFLTLLVAQLQHQDPLKPAEDTQFVSQLAQFSQLEFTQNSTSAISSLANSMQAFMDLQTLQAQSITNASATPLLGKDVRVMESNFEHSTGSREFNVYLSEGNRDGNVVIKDADGNVVAEIPVAVEGGKGGEAKVTWDGKDQKTGNAILGSKFTVEVMSANGKNIGYAYQDGKVSGVSFSSSGAAININGTMYGLGYLVDVKDPKGSQSLPDSSESDAKITESSIIFPATKGVEYSMDSGKTWQESSVFDDLKSDTEYKFLIRKKETENLSASYSVELALRTLAG